MTNTISIDRRDTPALSTGGITINEKNPSSVSGSRYVNSFDFMVCAAMRKSSTKSRLGIVARLASCTVADTGPSRSTLISWVDFSSSIRTPASMRTVMPRSWPERSVGARYSTPVTSGVAVLPARGSA